MKKVLFVINTLGQAGAENALLELLRKLDAKEYEISLYVLMGQGEMMHALPAYVKLLNHHYDAFSVLSTEGKKYLTRNVLRAMFRHFSVIKLFPYLVRHLIRMIFKSKVQPDKLLWRVLSDGGERFDEQFDLAVAYLEGGSAYYVADHIKAKRKAAFIHVDYGKAGYTRSLDKDCYLKYDRVFSVSDEVKKAFLEAYPECAERTDVFHNILNHENIISRSKELGGFNDNFQGMRLLSVGRLTTQKAFEVSIEAMKLLKEQGEPVRWYVLGEGDQRKKLEELVKKLGLEKDFLMPGAVDNPYPYMAQADIYVHASRFEGKSIAIQEAQILGKAMVVSDCSGNREQVIPGLDGLMCDLTPEAICNAIRELLHDEEQRKRLGEAAAKKNMGDESELKKLLSMI